MKSRHSHSTAATERNDFRSNKNRKNSISGNNKQNLWNSLKQKEVVEPILTTHLLETEENKALQVHIFKKKLEKPIPSSHSSFEDIGESCILPMPFRNRNQVNQKKDFIFQRESMYFP